MKPVATVKSNLLQTWVVMNNNLSKQLKRHLLGKKESWREQSVLRDFYSETFCQ